MKVLDEGLAQIGLSVTPAMRAALQRFFTMLFQWNQAYNLVGTDDLEEIIIRHGLDSLAVVPFLQGNRILDVGTGAGFPGLVWALVCPDRSFVLIDSVGKKTRFLKQVKHELNLNHVEVIEGRVETFTPSLPVDTIVFRAVGSLKVCYETVAHLMQPGTQIVLMKGIYPVDELAELPKNCSVRVQSIQVPFLQEARHLVWVSC